MNPANHIELALQSFPYGLFVVGSVRDESVRVIVANWATQVSFDPPLVSIAIEDDSTLRGYIEKSGVFSINVLAAGSIDTAKDFVRSSEPDGNKINGRKFVQGTHGTPLIEDAITSIECRVVKTIQTGDHVLFIGEVIEALVRREGDALTLKETGWRYRR